MRGVCLFLILLPACKLDFQRMLVQARVNVSSDDPERIALVRRNALPVGSIAHHDLVTRPTLGDGCVGRDYAEVSAIEPSEALLARAQQQFARLCATCHGPTGNGVSPVAQVMEKTKPASLLIPPVRDYPVGRVYRTVMFGYKLMPSYRDELTVREAWAIATYVKSLPSARGDLGLTAAVASPGPVCPGVEP